MLKEAIYIIFCSISPEEKEQYQTLSVEYMIKEKHILKENLLLVSDPQSTDLGKAIEALNQKRQHFNFNSTVSSMLYLAASCNIYNNLICHALQKKKHVFCNGSFIEILTCQKNTLNYKSIGWDLLKNTYHKMLETTHSAASIQYPDIIFFCISSFNQANIRVQSLNGNEVSAFNQKEYEAYLNKIRIAYQTISQDHEFTKHTNVCIA